MASSNPAISTPLWDALAMGALSIAGMGTALFGLLVLQREVAISENDWVALSILVNSTHFMASYRILYASRAEISAHRWSTLVVPGLLLATLIGGAFVPQRDAIYQQLVVGSSIYLAWHYTGQAWGMVAATTRICGLELTPRERLGIRFGMRTFLVLHILYALSGRLPPTQWIAPATYVRLYGWAFYGVCASAALSLAVGGLAYLAVRRRHGRLPLRAVVPWLALYLWYPFWYFVPGGFLFVQLSHALQYLAFPLRVEVNRYAAAAPRTPGQKRLRALVVYLGLLVAGTLILNGAPLAAWTFGEGWYSSPDARVIFGAFTNCVAIHHYFVDGAIWKLRDEKVRRDLFRHLDPPDVAGAREATTSPTRARSV